MEKSYFYPEDTEKKLKVLQEFGSRFSSIDFNGIRIDNEEELILLLYEMSREIKELKRQVEVLEYCVDTEEYYR